MRVVSRCPRHRLDVASGTGSRRRLVVVAAIPQSTRPTTTPRCLSIVDSPIPTINSHRDPPHCDRRLDRLQCSRHRSGRERHRLVTSTSSLESTDDRLVAASANAASFLPTLRVAGRRDRRPLDFASTSWGRASSFSSSRRSLSLSLFSPDRRLVCRHRPAASPLSLCSIRSPDSSKQSSLVDCSCRSSRDLVTIESTLDVDCHLLNNAQTSMAPTFNDIVITIMSFAVDFDFFRFESSNSRFFELFFAPSLVDSLFLTTRRGDIVRDTMRRACGERYALNYLVVAVFCRSTSCRACVFSSVARGRQSRWWSRRSQATRCVWSLRQMPEARCDVDAQKW